MRTARHGLSSVLAIAATAAALACSPASAPREPGPGLVRVPTPAGVPVAPTTSGTLSSDGGTVLTPDGALTLTVPAGALPEGTPLTITPIANTARGAVGGAYRLGPEGLAFAGPVTLTFAAPASYPPGLSISGVHVEWQDARGYWHRTDAISRDAAANTVTVSTDHFSDWALTWETGYAAAEGPIRLDQTVGIPFSASGTATLYFQGDDPSDTTYLLTGTLTVPDRIPFGDEECVPDQATKTLALNVAELHKSTPPVFRWGLGVMWTLSCSVAGGPPTTRTLPALFDTMHINLTRCPGDYVGTQVATPEHLSGMYTSDCGAEGTVSATWDLRACVDGLECLGADGCTGVTACTNGRESCACPPVTGATSG